METHLDIKNREIWKPFLVNLCLIILLFFLGIFIGLFFRQKQLLESEMLTRARAHLTNLTVTRKWTSQHGGIYVEKKPGVESSPFTEDPEITSTDGTVYIKKNSAMLTRELSELAKAEDGHTFRITSLRPLNPLNTPDEFERQGLLAFESGTKETHTKETIGDTIYFRYMAPLVITKECLGCHAEKNYREGDIRGGLSVKFDITKSQKEMKLNYTLLFFFSIAILISLFSTIYSLVRKLIGRLREALQIIHRMATTDDLTQLFNRRHFFNRFNDEVQRSIRYKHSMGIVMMDIDHFKKVNDDHGHHTGDMVLQQISVLLTQESRKSDIVARYGGEEFIVLLPETDQDGACAMAEKFRKRISELVITVDSQTSISLTASFGVLDLDYELLRAINHHEKLIQLADKVLYQAKSKGRNRVEISDPKEALKEALAAP